jgi:GT2 family glycosyltransferase
MQSDSSIKGATLKKDIVTPLIKCAIVLYKQRPEQAKSLSSLLEICRCDTSVADRIDIFIQDNSPEALPPVFDEDSPAIEYHHAPENPGLAAAYNKALRLANDREIPWLLLLDQDTVLDRRFLLQLLNAVQNETTADICSFVPELVRDGRVCSPHTVRRGSYSPLPLGFSGFADNPLVPCNSASCVKVQSLIAIDGFPEEYWLDFLDFIVFHRLQLAGGRVYVLDSRLEHSLSLLNLEAEMSVARYSNLLKAEWMFIRETGLRGGPLIHRLRLLKRALRHALKLNNIGYASETLRAVLK